MTVHPMTQPPTQEQVERIVAGLTKAQREALVVASPRYDGPGRPERWICLNAGRVKRGLLALGLAFEAVPMIAWRSKRRDIALTDLGLTVRTHLITKGSDQ